MAASVELQSPARETHYGMWLLNAITDNLVRHHRKPAKTGRPLISYLRSHCRPLTVSMTEGLGDNGPGAGRVPSSRWKDAELVALRIGKHDPRLLSLTDVRPAGTQLQQTVYLGRLVIRAEARCRRFLVSLRSPTGTKTKPGSRSGAGLISNSSSASNTTTQPRALAHHRPSSAGCAASTTTCSHSRLMGLMLLRSRIPNGQRHKVVALAAPFAVVA
jgi:hypothetical protein